MERTPGRVRLQDLTALHAPIRAELDAAMARVIDSGRFVLGEELEAFEHELAAYVGARAAVGCGSGSDALLLALMACDVGPGDEVIVPAYTFFASASAIARLGARPVFADIDPDSFAMDADHARRLAAGCKRLRAILPVHLFGRAGDVDGYLSLASELGVPVIEDAAQSIGARDASGAKVGSRAHLSCWSFYPTKNLGALGDGGMVTAHDRSLAERITALRSHGAHAAYQHEEVGINSRLDALQAAVLRVKLRHLEAWTKARAENAAYYDGAFAQAGASTSTQTLDDACLPLLTPAPLPFPARCVYHQYVVRVPGARRDALANDLRERGIETGIYYPVGLHQQPSLAIPGQRHAGLTATEAATRETLALPVHPELNRDARTRVAEEMICLLRG
jgi:dTDP-4-amino-4,6-dideoxygalactose transaminase